MSVEVICRIMHVYCLIITFGAYNLFTLNYIIILVWYEICIDMILLDITDWMNYIVFFDNSTIYYYLMFVVQQIAKIRQNVYLLPHCLSSMYLAVFEKAYIDRNLEVTGQQMVVVTPGAGMFQVDRNLASLTRQRIVDNGMSKTY